MIISTSMALPASRMRENESNKPLAETLIVSASSSPLSV